MGQRTLSERELNRALLARQLLLERVDVPLTTAIERVGELQTQYAPSGYIALWSRLARFERDDLTRALHRKRVVQATVMRQTIHMVTRRDYWPLTEGIRRARRDWLERAARSSADPRAMRSLARRVERLLADGPLRRAEIVRRLGIDSTRWNGVGVYLDLVRVPPLGTWERPRADLYDLAESWIGPGTATEAEGRALLARRYLAAFGPATRTEIATWAGLKPGDVEIPRACHCVMWTTFTPAWPARSATKRSRKSPLYSEAPTRRSSGRGERVGCAKRLSMRSRSCS